jgi:hypothetical protein
MAMNVVLETVPDAETARQVFVARALYQGFNYGNEQYIRGALTDLGLDDYVTPAGNVYKINTTKLLEAIGDSITVTINSGRTPERSDTTTNEVLNRVNVWRNAMTPDDYVKVEPGDKVIDWEDLTRRFGGRGTLPPVANEEVTATWRDLVTRTLEWGDKNTRFGRICPELESTLTALGFRSFMPPTTVNVTVNFKGIEMQLNGVRCDRSGKPDAIAVRDAYVNLAYNNAATEFVMVSPEVPASV